MSNVHVHVVTSSTGTSSRRTCCSLTGVAGRSNPDPNSNPNPNPNPDPNLNPNLGVEGCSTCASPTLGWRVASTDQMVPPSAAPAAAVICLQRCSAVQLHPLYPYPYPYPSP